MSRRDVEMFNFSFLDILSGALGAVLFLFIVVPKGGKSPELTPPLSITLDTVQGKFFGDLPDSLWQAEAGDSIFALVVDFARMPQIMDCPPQRKCPECPKCPEVNKLIVPKKPQSSQPTALNPLKPLASTPTERTEQPTTPASRYKGDLPSVPCKLSFEIKWQDVKDNVDLFVCKDGSCVYGGRRKNTTIGFWDSGKSKTSIFGGDLRTTQEAVRQFDQILPGTYDLYLQYKAAETPKSSVRVDGLVYTKADDQNEKGETFVIDLPFNTSDRTLIGKVTVDESGQFQFSKQF